jgi:regulator of nucleoside diphosphate kinase
MNSPRLYVTDRDLKRLREVIADAAWQGGRPHTDLEQLEAELGRRKTVAADEVPGDVITLNSQVQLFDLDTAESFACTLVLPQAADIRQFKVSVLAPVGRTLLGHRVGDTIEWPVPGGLQRLQVTMLLFQPEAAGDYSLP